MLHGQGGWKKKYSLQNSLSSICRNVIEAPNGSFIMIGVTYDTVSNPGTSRLTIAGTDPSGNLLWRKDYGSQNFEYLDNILAQEGAVVYDENFFYHTLPVKDTGNWVIGVLIKFNYNGDTVWQKVFRDPLEDLIPQGICKNVDGGFLITGFLQNWTNNTNPCLLLKTDASGNELWRKSINKISPNVHDGKSIVQDSATKKIITVGYQYIGPNSDTHSNIMVFDSLGSKLTQVAFTGPGGAASIFAKVIQLKDKNFLACGILNANNDIGNLTRYRCLVVKFDINANTIWSRTYDTISAFLAGSYLVETPNADILIAAAIDTLINYGIEGPTKMRLHKIDQNGNVIWHKYIGSAYSYTNSEYPRSMNPTSDGGVILSSWLFNYPNSFPHPYSIVKIDSTGCDTLEAYCKLQAVGLSNFYKLIGFDFEVFPNPTQSSINIGLEAPETTSFLIKIINATGQQLENFEINGGSKLLLNTTNYSPGVYFINLFQENNLIETRKLVIMK